MMANERDGDMLVPRRRPRPPRRKRLGELLGTAISRGIDAGLLPGWPKKVVFVTFFGRGDYAALADFADLAKNMSVVRGTFIADQTKMVIDRIDEKSGLPTDLLRRAPSSRRVRVTDPTRNQREIDVQFMDVSTIVAAKTPLAALGADLGFPKLELPEGYSADNMARFMAEQPAEFRRYAKRDALITGLAAERYRRFCRETLGIARPPRTLGGLAVMEFFKTLKEKGIEPDKLFGREVKRTRRYSKASGRISSALERVNSFAMQIVDQAATDGYNGGRTENFLTGPITAPDGSAGGGFLYDIDLRSAYPTGMAEIGLPDWPAVYLVAEGGDPSQFTAHTLGFAEVKFECPPDMHFPPFGVRTEHGLIFPLKGCAITTAPEIASALFLGVKVRVLKGVIVPWNQEIRPYEDFVVKMVALRNSLKVNGRDTLESKTVKEVTNSLYGKHGQGARPKSAFDPESGGSRQMGRSPVTCPLFAGWTTGLVRAAVFELLNGVNQ